MKEKPPDRRRGPKPVGSPLSLARVKRRWTLADMSLASGISVPRLSVFEHGWKRPGLAQLLRIASALGMRLDRAQKLIDATQAWRQRNSL